MEHAWTIVMAGGVGSRFWPVSRAERPKQLLDLFGEGPMVRAAIERMAPIVPLERQIVVTGEILRGAMAEALPDLPPPNLLCEPAGRNTAPAIAWAALTIHRRDPHAILAALPADQHITDPEGFRAVARRALRVAAERQVIATVGIAPTRPETGYGYIARGAALEEGVYQVAAFTEKPSLDVALTYLASGAHDWNAGMFFMPAALVLAELRRFEPELMASLEGMGADALAAVYPTLRKISIDYAVMERTERIAVIPGSFGWSDVGSWRSLWDLRTGAASTFARGDVLELDGGGNVLFADDGGMVAAVGVQDLVVVHTRDATFVCRREDAQRAREIVARLEADGREELL